MAVYEEAHESERACLTLILTDAQSKRDTVVEKPKVADILSSRTRRQCLQRSAITTYVGKKLMKPSPSNWEQFIIEKTATLGSLSARTRPVHALYRIHEITSPPYGLRRPTSHVYRLRRPPRRLLPDEPELVSVLRASASVCCAAIGKPLDSAEGYKDQVCLT